LAGDHAGEQVRGGAGGLADGGGVASLVEQLQDELGECGWQLDGRVAECQRQLGVLLVDVFGGEGGDAWQRYAEQQDQRSGDADVERQGGVVDAAAQLGGVLLGVEERPGALGAACGDGEWGGQVVAGGPAQERGDLVAARWSSGEPLVDVVLADGVQGGVVVVDQLRNSSAATTWARGVCAE